MLDFPLAVHLLPEAGGFRSAIADQTSHLERAEQEPQKVEPFAALSLLNLLPRKVVK